MPRVCRNEQLPNIMQYIAFSYMQCLSSFHLSSSQYHLQVIAVNSQINHHHHNQPLSSITPLSRGYWGNGYLLELDGDELVSRFPGFLDLKINIASPLASNNPDTLFLTVLKTDLMK